MIEFIDDEGGEEVSISNVADWIFTISRWNFFTSLLKKTRGYNIVPECSTNIVVVGAKLVLTHRENICRDVGDRASILINKRKSEVAVCLILVLLDSAETVPSGLNLHFVFLTHQVYQKYL